MKKCMAFSAIPGSREAWIPCMRDAQEGYALCQRHSDAVAGVMMGICIAGIAQDAKEKLKRERRAERKRLAAFRRKIRVAGKARRFRKIELLLHREVCDVAVNRAGIVPRALIAEHEQA